MPSSVGPSSFMSWKRPVAGVHPRYYLTNRKRVAIVSIVNGPFTHGSTITWSGGSGKVVENTPNGVTFLYYEPVSGSPVSAGQTITSGATTTTALLSAGDDGLSVAAMQARKNGAFASEWASHQSWLSSVQNNSSSYWQANRAPEYIAGLAFSYLIGGNTTHGNKAVTEAVAMASLGDPGGSHGRARMTAMAYVYDWCYGLMNGSQRTSILNALAAPSGGPGYIRTRFDPGDDNFVWGPEHGDECYAFVSLLMTLEDDPDTADCNTQVGWMNSMMDTFDNGTDVGCYWPIFRHFGNTDGGSHKGSGTYGYNVVNLDFYFRVLFGGQSALVTNFYEAEPWYGKMMDWVVWHLRADMNNHSQGDERHLNSAQFHIHSSVHAIQVADRDSSIRGEVAQWYVKTWVPQAANQVIWGPYFLFPLLWGRTTAQRPATEPTLSNFNAGSPIKHFANAGKTIIRNGWKKTSTSLAVCRPLRFSGDHQHQDIGHFAISAHEEILACSAGHYDPDQSSVFQDDLLYQPTPANNPSWAESSGHRFTFQQSGLAKNSVRVFSQLEDDTANQIKNSFQKHCGASSTFGRGHMSGGSFVGTRSNYGGPMLPKKDPGGACQDIPEDLADWNATAVWNFASLAHAKTYAGENHAYFVLNLSPWYWSGKQTRMKRHFLWIKEDSLPGYSHPIVIVWDDLITSIDAHATKGGKKTQIIQLQTQVAPQSGGSPSSMSFLGARGKGKLFVRSVGTALEHRIIGGVGFQAFQDADGNIYPPSETNTFDDSTLGAWRNEWNPAAQTTSPKFLMVYAPTPAAVATVPTFQLIDEATAYGVRIQSGTDILEARMQKGDTHAVTVGSPTDTTPPAVPTPSPPNAVAGDGQVSLDWNDQFEADLAGFRVYRSQKVGGVFQSDLLIAEKLPSQSSHLDDTVVNGEIYRYAISAFDLTLPVANESAKTAYTSDQAPVGPPPPDDPPPAPGTPVAVAGNSQVSVDWPDLGIGDLDVYKLWREQFTAGAWGSETLIDGSIVPSQKVDTTAVNGNTYRYRVSAVDDAAQEGPKSDYSNVVMPSAPAGPPSTNNKFRSSWQWPWNTLPAAIGVPLGQGDRRHVSGLYALESPPGPTVDISIGAPLVCTEPHIGGSPLETPAPTPGTALETPVPLSGQPISETEGA